MATHFPERFPVTLQDRPYMVDFSNYRRTTVPVLREQRDQSSEPGEQSLNTQQWVRSQTDWSHGAGQTFLDNDDSDRLRFDSSAGVDPWTKGKVSLLPLCESKNNANVWTDVLIRQFGSYVYVASGTDLWFTANISAADSSVTWTKVTALASPQTITSMASDGSTVFVTYGAARVLSTTGIGSTTAPATLGATTPDWCRIVGGRLVVGDGARIIELDAAGGVTGLDATSTHAGMVWLDAVGGPAGVYAAGNTDTGILFYIPILDSAGLLQYPQQVAELPHGETINAVEAYGGFLILATSKGLRLAAVNNQSGGVTVGPVIDDGGEAYAVAVDDKFAWWGSASGQVWRADLSTFTGTLIPAYASDLVSVGDGNGLGNVTGIVRAGGRTVFVDAGNGVQGQESAGILVATGTLTVGQVRWNSQYDKVLRTIEVRSTPAVVATGNQAFDDAAYTFDTADSFFNGLSGTVAGTVKGQFTDDNALDSDVLTLPNKVSTVVTPTMRSGSFTVVFTLLRDGTTTTAGPFVESWMMQAFPAPLRIDEIIVPVVLKRRVGTSRGMGAAATVDSQAEYDALRTLMVDKTVCTYREGSRSESVVIDQVSMAAERLSDNADWWEGVLTLRLLTVPS